MKYVVLFSIGLWLAVQVAFTQEVKFEIQDSILGKYSSFSTDNFGRVYLVENDVIIEFSWDFDTLFSTSLKSVRPTSIESSKSFRSLVFDQERSVVHFLDNTLTDIYGQIDLMSLDFQQPYLVCESFAGNTFWVYDAGAMRLIKLNENLETVSITENLARVFGNTNLPSRMREFNDFLYVLLPEKGIVMFDVFGTYIGLLETPKIIDFDVFGKFLVVMTDDGLHTYPANPVKNFGTPLFTYPVPFKAKQFAMNKDKFFFLTDTGLYIGVYKSTGKSNQK